MENRSAEFQPVFIRAKRNFRQTFFSRERFAKRSPLAGSLVENVVEGTGKDTRNEIEGGLIPRDNTRSNENECSLRTESYFAFRDNNNANPRCLLRPLPLFRFIFHGFVRPWNDIKTVYLAFFR